MGSLIKLRPQNESVCCGETKQITTLKELQLLAGNDLCVNCSSDAPDWADISHGILICLRCAGKHRGLGVHLSVVKSLTLDEWDPQQIEMMHKGGNQRFEEYMRVVGLSLSYENIEANYTDPQIERYRSKLNPKRKTLNGSGLSRNQGPPSSSHVLGRPAIQRPPVWVSDEVATNCMLCNSKFSLFWRRHHCRRCGLCVCNNCAPGKNTRPILEWGFAQPVRHCILCYQSPLLGRIPGRVGKCKVDC
mmetsp:Transcript_11640/g.17895  ORF Transcript_11640/g.17895 Transcript_11640/m.17895 type:complete len:247 (+) Transcript_11640:55-795(+)